MLTVFTALSLAAAGSFTVLPAGTTARGVSADGSVVVGSASDPAWTGGILFPFRWTAKTGVVHLSDYSSVSSGATAISADGSVIVGVYQKINGYESSFRWTAAEGFTDWDVTPLALTPDGSVITGQGRFGNFTQAFRWTAETDAVPLGDIEPDHIDSQGYAISADGSVIAGTGSPSGGGSEAIRWTSETGVAPLGFIPAYPPPEGWPSSGAANAISADGSVIVGRAQSHPFRWTESGGMVDLGLPAGAQTGSANAISADGSIVVGSCDLGAVRWDAEHGAELLSALAASAGLDLQGLNLTEATAISPDGIVIVGNGTDSNGKTHAWLWKPSLTEPPPATPGKDAPPTLSAPGKSPRVTHGATALIRVRVQGKATVVIYRVAPSKISGRAAAKPSWHFTAKLRPGRNVITLVAQGPGGRSKPIRVVVVRR